MFFKIELLILVLMIAAFFALLLLLKLPTGISLMATAVVGLILGGIFNGTSITTRYLIEGAFAYFDVLLTICFSMLFFGALKLSGGLDYLSVKIVRLFKKTPTLLLICLAILVMFPGMVTGSALCACMTTGMIVLPILIKWGVPKNKAAAFVVAEAILGEVAPPINLPAMIICDTADLAYVEYTLPLLILSLPIALVIAVVLCRKYVKPISGEELGNIVDLSVEQNVTFLSLLPIIVVILFMIFEVIFPKYLSIITLTLIIGLCVPIVFLTGKKYKFYSKNEEEVTIVNNLVESIKKSLGLISIIMGVGMMINVITLNGVRGYLYTNFWLLPETLRICSVSILLPLIGGVSSYAAAGATVLGGSLLLHSTFNTTLLVGGFSLLSGIGGFLPPSSVPSCFVGEQIEEKKTLKIAFAGLPAIIIMFVYAIFYGFILEKITISDPELMYLIYFLIVTALAIISIVVYNIVLSSLRKKQNKEVK